MAKLDPESKARWEELESKGLGLVIDGLEAKKEDVLLRTINLMKGDPNLFDHSLKTALARNVGNILLDYAIEMGKKETELDNVVSYLRNFFEALSSPEAFKPSEILSKMKKLPFVKSNPTFINSIRNFLESKKGKMYAAQAKTEDKIPNLILRVTLLGEIERRAKNDELYGWMARQCYERKGNALVFSPSIVPVDLFERIERAREWYAPNAEKRAGKIALAFHSLILDSLDKHTKKGLKWNKNEEQTHKNNFLSLLKQGETLREALREIPKYMRLAPKPDFEKMADEFAQKLKQKKSK